MIESNRIYFRCVKSSDLDKLMLWRNKNRSFFFNQKKLTVHTQHKWFEQQKINKQNKMFIIVEKKTRQAIGYIGLCNIKKTSFKNKIAEVCQVLIGEESFRRNGYALEALQMLMIHSFDALGITQIFSLIFAFNRAGVKLFELAGFKISAVLREELITLAAGRGCIIVMEAS